MQGDACQRARHVAGFALDGVPQDVHRPASRAGHLGRGLQRHLWCGDGVGFDAGQAGVARLDRLGFAAVQQRLRARRQGDLVAPQDVQCVAAVGGVGHGGAGRDVDGLVTRHVGQQQVDHPGRAARGGQAPALDGRQVPAHAVHLADAGTAGQQCAVDGLFVGQAQAGQCQRQQGGAAAGNEAQHQIVGGQPLHQRQHATGGGFTGCIGHRMGGFHNLDVLAGHRMPIPCDHQPG